MKAPACDPGDFGIALRAESALLMPETAKSAGTPERFQHVSPFAFFEVDSLPEWRGWHAFRRGLATNLYRLGVPDKTIQQILRHSNVSVTQACYIKTSTPDAKAAMKRFEAVVKSASNRPVKTTKNDAAALTARVN